jgi:ABC-type glycerol-3-phosphate transport system permease component
VVGAQFLENSVAMHSFNDRWFFTRRMFKRFLKRLLRVFTRVLLRTSSYSFLIATLILALMFSFAIARLVWKYSGHARIYMIIGMFIPLQVIMIPLAILVRDFHLSNTYGALIPWSCRRSLP